MIRFASLILLMMLCGPVLAKGWPARLAAPYLYLGAPSRPSMVDLEKSIGQKYFVLAFIIARQTRDGPTIDYLPQPTWDGRVPMGKNFYLGQINAIRRLGGDVIVSFGGEAGRELAIIETDPARLGSDYQSIIDRYHLTWLDFDIEGKNLTDYPAANRRRNQALALLQKKNPGLRISYTLPVNPDGLSDASLELLGDARKQGLRVYEVNLMVMFFGNRFIHKGRSEGQLGIDSAIMAHKQIQKIDPTIQIGLCPCIGRNGSRDEVFDIDDAKTLIGFAEQTPWVCALHFWSINHDRRSIPPWAFARLFRSFTTP